MKKLIKLLLIIFCAILFLSISIAGISAYLINTDTAVNVLTIGNNNIEIFEDFPVPNPQPGSSHKKVVQITNTGSVECYVRVLATFSNSDMGDYCSIDWNTNDWVYNSSDGYWYYTGAIAAGEATQPLFTKITIFSSISEENMKDFEVIVYAESLQSRGFANYQVAWEEFQKNKPDQYIYNTVSMKAGALKSRVSCSVSAIKAVKFTDSVAPSGVNLDDLSANGDKSVVGWLDASASTYYISSQRSGYAILAPATSSSLFEGFTEVTTFDFTNFDASQITTTSYMFNSCKALKTVDLSNWNILNIAYMGAMFSGCTSLESVNLSNWNTSNLVYFDEAFDGCSSLKSVSFAGWKTQKLVDITYLFNGCKSLTVLDLSSWDTSKIEDSGAAFRGCTAITTALARTQTDADNLNAIVQKSSTTASPLNWSFKVK